MSPERSPPDVEIVFTGDDAFVVFNGVRIAKRGYPKTPQAGTWVSLEPGWRVFGGGTKDDLVIQHKRGARPLTPAGFVVKDGSG